MRLWSRLEASRSHPDSQTTAEVYQTDRERDFRVPRGGSQHCISHLATGEKPWLQEDRKQGLGMGAQAPSHPRSFLEADPRPGREGSSSVPGLLGRKSAPTFHSESITGS